MNMKKTWKRFFSLNRHHAEGFTLVELIVVIAILAILGGVAVPAYSGYVEKANKAADIALIGEVQHALTLGYYSGVIEGAAAIKLSAAGVEEIKGEGVEEAMQATFGEAWRDVLKLQWDGWNGVSSTLSYKNSNYFGNESELIGTVDSLTSALGKVVADQKASGNDLMGNQFTDFLEDKGVDATSGKGIGNAAVLYVAENTAKAKPEDVQNAFTTGINNAMASGDSARIAESVFTQLQNKLGNVGAMAAIYAYAEGYAQYSGQADDFHAGNDKFNNVTDLLTAVGALGESFKSLENPADPEKSFVNYVKNGYGQKDLEAYLDMMSTIHENSNIVSGNLNSPDCFTDGTVENMLKGHAEMSSLGITTDAGQAAVVLVVDADGSVMTCVAPPNYNK